MCANMALELKLSPWNAGDQALALLLSPEGTFVREILLEELAKGLDAAWRLAADQQSVALRQRLQGLLGVRLPEVPSCGAARACIMDTCSETLEHTLSGAVVAQSVTVGLLLCEHGHGCWQAGHWRV